MCVIFFVGTINIKYTNMQIAWYETLVEQLFKYSWL